MNTEEDAYRVIREIYEKIDWIDTLDIVPIQNYVAGPRPSDSYKFGDQLEFYTKNQNRKVSGIAKDNLLKSINWKLTLHEILEAIESYDQIIFDVMNDDSIDLEQKNPKEYNRLKEIRNEIGAVEKEFRIKIARDELGMGLSKIKAGNLQPLRGRGLRGAGIGLKGYSSTSKNLRSIQGSGTASDLKYRQLGSKFIRITDLRLDQPRLKLVYANRTQVGRLKDISKPVARVIEILVFNQDIDQQLYNKLSLSDKQTVHDLLR